MGNIKAVRGCEASFSAMQLYFSVNVQVHVEIPSNESPRTSMAYNALPHMQSVIRVRIAIIPQLGQIFMQNFHAKLLLSQCPNTDVPILFYPWMIIPG